MIRTPEFVSFLLVLAVGLHSAPPYACYLPLQQQQQQLDLVDQLMGAKQQDYYGYEDPLVYSALASRPNQLLNDPWSASRYQMEGSSWAGQQDVAGPPGRAALAAGDPMQDKIVGLLNELRSRQGQYSELQRRRAGQAPDEDLDNSVLQIVDDTNIHLPANDPVADGGDRRLSGPINDPADFEAALGQLTDKLNHELPNSINRSLILDDLLASKLNDISGYKSSSMNDDDDDDTYKQQEDVLNELGELLAQREKQQQQQLQQQQQQQVAITSNSSDDDDADTDTDDDVGGTSGGSEYIDHPLALAGHQYVQGGAGEGRQLLGPEGTFENVQVIKSDHAVPSYCDPPNPCPLGYSAKDGCLEQFVNSASFSREYQAKQQCSCDNEHSLFNCAVGPSTSSLKDQHVGPSSSSSSSSSSSDGGDGGDGGGDDDNNNNDSNNVDLSGGPGGEGRTWGMEKLDTLARTIQNRFGDLASVKNLIASHDENEN